MQPDLVAGAWVGFDDGRVTLRSDYWGQGAHSALPIVGDFFQHALRARLIDGKAHFDTEAEPGWFESLKARVTDWVGGWFKSGTPPAAVKMQRPPRPTPEESEASAPEAASEGIVEEWVPASDVAASAAALASDSAASSANVPATPSNGAENGSAGPAATPPAAPAPQPVQPPAAPETGYEQGKRDSLP